MDVLIEAIKAALRTIETSSSGILSRYHDPRARIYIAHVTMQGKEYTISVLPSDLPDEVRMPDEVPVSVIPADLPDESGLDELGPADDVVVDDDDVVVVDDDDVVVDDD